MGKPIYKCIMGKLTGAFYRLNEEERKKVLARSEDNRKKAGGRQIIVCNSAWSAEQYEFFGIEEYPDIEAVYKVAELDAEIRQYFDVQTCLGTAWSEAAEGPK